jgi:hypothetical protein
MCRLRTYRCEMELYFVRVHTFAQAHQRPCDERRADTELSRKVAEFDFVQSAEVHGIACALGRPPTDRRAHQQLSDFGSTLHICAQQRASRCQGSQSCAQAPHLQI